MIVRCEFEKHEPVRNVTALAVMWYCCNFLSSCRTDGMIGMGERVRMHPEYGRLFDCRRLSDAVSRVACVVCGPHEA